MNSASDTDAQPRRQLGLMLRLFLELSLGAIGVFVLATIAGPRLFDMHDNLALAGAVLVWLACPVLLYVLGADAIRLWRRINGGPST